MKKSLCFGKGGLARYIPRFIHPSQKIRNNYPNHPKMHMIENLVLIAEDEKAIRINSGLRNVCNVHMLISKGVEFYAARRYFHLEKEGRE